MKSICKVITTVATAAFASVLLVPAASACGYSPLASNNVAARALRQDPNNPLEAVTSDAVVRDMKAAAADIPSIVGMWSFQFISKGNANNNPSIPDGAVLDFGYTQWHSDGTELLNSGSRAPATENFCMGVWEKTGPKTYVLTHLALSYDATSGLLNGKTVITESITLSNGGTMFSGTVTLNLFDAKGNPGPRLTGQVTATRITVDTTTP